MTDFTRIVLVMGQDIGYCRGVLRGVQSYAAGQESWIFRDAPPDLSILPAIKEWDPAGIIAHLFLPELAEGLIALGKPIVNVTSTLKLDLPLVEVDHLEVGRLAAEHFLDAGFRHFGYFGSATAGYSVERERGFRQRLRQAGFDCCAQHANYLPRPVPGSSWTEIDDQVCTWLLDLNKPVGILASNDVPGRELSEICRMLELHVPEEVALVGVDDDEFECRLAYPPLSSIAVPSERVGYEAASLLSRLMHQPAGSRATPKPICLPPEGVVVRQSSDVVAVQDPDLAAVLRFIRQRACDRISVEDVVAEVAVSRRKLERKFRIAMDRTIHEEIRRMRLVKAKRLLAESELPMPDIARQSGFDSARRMAVVFRQAEDMTPTEFRAQFRLQPRVPQSDP